MILSRQAPARSRLRSRVLNLRRYSSSTAARKAIVQRSHRLNGGVRGNWHHSLKLMGNIARAPSPSTNRHRRAKRRDAVLVEAFDRNPVGLPHCERSELERRSLVDEALVSLIKLRWRDTPAQIVAHDSRHRPPADGSIALVVIASRCHASRRRGARAHAVTEDAKIADGEIRR